MATIGNTYLSLIDSMKQSDNGLWEIVEALALLNPFMQDANFLTCNMGKRHRSSIRTGLPSVSWGALYEGIAQSKSTTTQVEDTTGFVEGLSTVDDRLLKLHGEDANKIRMSEGMSFLEAIAQEVESSIFYSDVAVNGRKFHGLAARYNALANQNVVDGGGAGGDNTSIWMVTHGDQQTSLITPAGIPAGITQEDMGKQRVLDANGDPYYAQEEMFTQHVGVVVKDWRFTGRIANIDVSNVIAGSVQINPLMRNLYYKLQGRRNYKFNNQGQPVNGRTVIYMNRTMLEALDAESTNDRTTDNFIRLSTMEIQGQEVMSWRGIPIRETDSLLNTEALVA